MKRDVRYILILLFVGVSVLLTFKLEHQTAREIDKADISQKLKALSMPFIENKGQTDPKVAFYAKTFAGSFFITKEGELVYSFPEVEDKKVVGTAVLIERLGKVNQIKGLGEASTKVNYFIGNDPNKWQRDISTFEKVSLGYESMRVELKAYGGNIGKLLYVFPYVDVKSIRIELEGVKEATIKESGELILKTKFGDIEFTKPVAYQEINGKRVYVPISYKLLKNSKKLAYAFEVGKYDKSKELVIDYLCRRDWDFDYTIVSDGNYVYMVSAVGSDKPFGRDRDAFVAKLNNDLTQIIQATYLGGSGDDVAYAIVLDDVGNVYVSGYTSSGNFPKARSKGNDFVARLTEDLKVLVVQVFAQAK